MIEDNIYDKVLELRSKDIAGETYELIPVSEKYLADIVRIRNQNINSQNMSLQPISLSDQQNWFYEYKLRNDDLYWVVVNKSGKTVATIRLDAITYDEAEIGSLAIEQTYDQKIQCFEYAVRTAAQIAFRDLGIRMLWASVPVGNDFMHRLDARIGFTYRKKETIRGNQYDILELSSESYFWKTELKYLLKQEQYELISQITPRGDLRNKLDWITGMLLSWLKLRQNGINILASLKEKGIEHIAIYGGAVLGEQMIEETLDIGLGIEYVIDRNAKNYKGIEYYSPDDMLPTVDAIVITCMENSAVKEALGKKVSADLLHISELIEKSQKLNSQKETNYEC